MIMERDTARDSNRHDLPSTEVLLEIKPTLPECIAIWRMRNGDVSGGDLATFDAGFSAGYLRAEFEMKNLGCWKSAYEPIITRDEVHARAQYQRANEPIISREETKEIT